MEYHQSVQNRAFQTVAVLNLHLPGMSVGNVAAADLRARAEGLNLLAQSRNDALVQYERATSAEKDGFEVLRRLVLNLPKAAESELDRRIAAEATLLGLLDPVYAIAPRNTDMVQQRAQRLLSALESINAYLAAQTPPRGPVRSAGAGAMELAAVLAGHPALEQAVENHAARVSTARSVLRMEAGNVDQINKRFYKKLRAEARSSAVVAAALEQISTESDALPGTLGIESIIQGGIDGLHLMVSFEVGTGTGATQKELEWMVEPVDRDFVHAMEVDLNGSVLGPFRAQQNVKIRTRVSNGKGSRTGSVRTMLIREPVIG
ncbi:MAG: hypothetical protein V4710_02725 [Verrucomicrobiota bacterium]